MTGEPFSLYVHVPFCSQKCPYCDFNTYAVREVPDREYVDALITELNTYENDPRFAGRRLRSIFFGGGTPSLLSPASIGRVIEQALAIFPALPDIETTLEANPSSPSQERYEAYRSSGINRISFGVQSFDSARLSQLGRDHTADDARRAIFAAVGAGITNVSLDIIFGVPEQTLTGLRDDLREASKLPITHLSTYALSIEPGTPFFQRQERGLLAMPPEERTVEMLSMIPHVLAEHGFSRYEISNYARGAAWESRHNKAYWIGDDYLGIGAGAHSYAAQYQGGVRLAAERWSSYALPATYIEHARKGTPVSWREMLDSAALHFEFFYLGLRRAVGVSREDFQRLFACPIPVRIEETLVELVREGYLEDDGTIRLTERGIALSDSVFERLA